VLLLARSFPPVQAIAAVRTGSIAKQLAMRGWEVTVATVRPDIVDENALGAQMSGGISGVRRIECGHGLRFLLPGLLKEGKSRLRRAFSRAGRRLARALWIEDGVGWINPVLTECRDLEAGSFDVVLVSGPPFMGYVAARRLAIRLRCALVVDYRDPWTVSAYRSAGAPFWMRRLEAKLLRSADLVTTVSPSLAEVIERLGDGRTKVRVVSNGYDPEASSEAVPRNFGHPAIVYAGEFYPPKSTIAPVMRLLASAKGRVPGLRLHYYGRAGSHVLEAARKAGVAEMVEIHGLVARREVLDAIAGALAAVVITSVEPECSRLDAGIVTGKLFEPMALKCPVLLIAPEGSDARDVVARAACGRAFRGDEIEGMREFVEALWRGEERPSFAGMAEYSWPVLIAGLAEALQTVVDERRA